MNMGIRKLLLISMLYFGIVCNYLTYAIMAPFFPELALEKGLTISQYSLVFTVYSLAQLVASVVVGRYLAVITPKFGVCAGLFLSGGATVLFGVMADCPGPSLFFILCLLIRVLEGCGFSAYLTSCFSILISEFPEFPGSVTGLAEMFVTIAMISGPPIGGILYTLGGYSCPFLIFGVLMLLMVCGTSILVPSKITVDSEPPTMEEYRTFMRHPESWMNIICVSMNVMADSFITITLVEFLKHFVELSAIQLGGVFLCLFLSYGISAPLSGWLADRWYIEYELQTTGCLIVAASFGLLGPASFIKMEPRVWSVILALLIKGIGAGPLISCSLSSALRAALKNAGPDDEFRINSMVSSSVTFSIPLGNVLGSALSGIMYSDLGMEKCCTVFFIIYLLLGLVLGLMATKKYCKNPESENINLINR